jgi:purine nucleoside permease
MLSMRCVNCAGTVQDFRRLTDAEKTYVAGQKPKHTRLGAYYRCSRDGCLRFQRLGNHKDGGSFPKPETEAPGKDSELEAKAKG